MPLLLALAGALLLCVPHPGVAQSGAQSIDPAPTAAQPFDPETARRWSTLSSASIESSIRVRSRRSCFSIIPAGATAS